MKNLASLFLFLLFTVPAWARITIHFVNVGQAAAAIVEFDGAVILIDAGADDFTPAGAQNLKDALQQVFTARPKLNNTLEAVIVSHPHIDHTGNLGVVFQKNGPFKVNLLVDNGETVKGSGLDALNAARKLLPAARNLAVKQSDMPPAGKGKPLVLPGLGKATITLLSGFQGCEDSSTDANNDSIALVIRDPDDGGGSAFFGGDAENVSKLKTCTPMLTQLNKLDTSVVSAKVYHAMHHGSPNGSLDEFQKKVHPVVSVISSGVLDWRDCKTQRFNAYCYGHPRDGDQHSGPKEDDALSTLEKNTSGSRPAKTVYFMAKSGDSDPNAPVSARQETQAVYDPAWDGKIDIVFQNGQPVVTTQLQAAPVPKDSKGAPIQVKTQPLALQAAAARKPTAPPPPSSGFSYYMLVMSYAPNFCQETGSKAPPECGPASHFGFVVHGLWPQGETTRGPENCASQGPIPEATFQAMLKYFPTRSLIQHEWTAHGTCSGLSMNDYFAAVKKTRDSVTIPPSLVATKSQTLPPAEVVNRVAGANTFFPNTAFRTSCYNDNELQEIRVCFNKDLSPRACGPSAGQCPAKNVTLLPVH